MGKGRRQRAQLPPAAGVDGHSSPSGRVMTQQSGAGKARTVSILVPALTPVPSIMPAQKGTLPISVKSAYTVEANMINFAGCCQAQRGQEHSCHLLLGYKCPTFPFLHRIIPVLSLVHMSSELSPFDQLLGKQPGKQSCGVRGLQERWGGCRCHPHSPLPFLNF